MGERGQRPGALRRARGVAVRFPLALAAGALLLLLACSREAPAPAPTPPGPAVPPAAAAAPSPATAVGPQLTYQPEGRRDPFRDVLDARLAEEGGEGIDYAGLKVAGIVWHRQGYYALVEAADGLGHILRVNDSLGKTGRVRQITAETVVIEVRGKDFAGRAHTRTITLELTREETLLEMKKDGKQPASKKEDAPLEKKEGSQ